MRHRLLPSFIAVLDVLGVILSVMLALFLRFDGQVPMQYLYPAIHQIPVFALIMLGVHCLFKLYTRVWRYAGTSEGISLVLAAIVDAILWTGCSYMLGSPLPRSIYIMSAFILLILAGGLRFSLRVYIYFITRPEYLRKINEEQVRRVLIYGAGDAGVMLLRELLNHKDNRRVVGFIDDDKKKKHSIILGVKILGTREEIADIVVEENVEEILIAMPSVQGQIVREIVDLCRKTGVMVKTLPGVYELVDGVVHMNQLRDIEVEDLLGRDAVQLDEQEVREFLQGKVLLVTGAGGSIGSEICRQVARMHPKKLLLLGKGENSIYEIDRELRRTYPELLKVPIIADVRDRERVREILRIFHPQVVFHAAAHKHVPLMEYQPMEAVRNNIMGTRVLAEETARAGVSKFVMISTDKAVNPTSVMGCTKRVAEMFVQSMNTSGAVTKFVAVRFGNVLGSRGSVVPLFKRQIAMGGPVTVTDPEMERYFMTIPEASQLVMQAGAMAKGGEVFVLDMGKPVKIVDLAKDMISLSGLVPGQDIQIQFTGLRPGEKLFEELLSAEDGTDATAHEKIFTARLKKIEPEKLRNEIDLLLEEKDGGRVVAMLKKIVPTYTPNRDIL